MEGCLNESSERRIKEELEDTKGESESVF